MAVKERLGLPLSYRSTDTDYLIERINSGESVLLSSIPGIGKSTFLRFIASNQRKFKKLNKNTMIILIDINDLTSISSIEFYRLLLKRLYDQTKNVKKIKGERRIREIFSETKSETDKFYIFEGLKEILDILSNKNKFKIAILVDRFNKIVEGRKAPFFNNLKSIRDVSKGNISFVCASAYNLLDIIDMDTISEFYKLVSQNTYNLMPLSKRDSKPIFTQYVRKKLKEKTRKNIEKLSGGYPPFIISLIEINTEHEENSKEFIKADKTLRFRLKEVWKSLTSDEKVALKRISTGTKHTDLDVVLRSKLENKGLINGAGEIFSPLFSDFIKQIKLDKLALNSTNGDGASLRINEKTNVVLKDGKELKRPLTNQEFKLLFHFLRNPGRICSRDEIAKEVWGEEAIEGVSDEAIDQVVSRLRGKIENNRNNPKLIVTIRGRGFQYKS